MEPLITFITSLGILAILFVIFAESGLLIGFLLPGDSLLFTAGFLVQKGYLDINIHLFVFLLFLAAAAGDNVGYTFGHKVGRKLFEKENSRFFKKEHLVQAEAFYEKYGSLTIILARFVPIVRTFAPVVAGASKMHYRSFMIYNIIGGALWTAGFTYLGYYAGKILNDMGVNVELVAIIIIVLSVAPMIIHALKNPDRRQKLIEGTKRQLRTILKK